MNANNYNNSKYIVYFLYIQEWEDHKKDRGVGYKYAWNKDMFDEIDTRSTDYVLGNYNLGQLKASYI